MLEHFNYQAINILLLGVSESDILPWEILGVIAVCVPPGKYCFRVTVLQVARNRDMLRLFGWRGFIVKVCGKSDPRPAPHDLPSHSLQIMERLFSMKQLVCMGAACCAQVIQLFLISASFWGFCCYCQSPTLVFFSLFPAASRPTMCSFLGIAWFASFICKLFFI